MVSSTPRPHFNPGKDPVPILQEAGWAPGPVWMGGKSRLHRDSIPDRPVRSSVAIPTELPGPQIERIPSNLYNLTLPSYSIFLQKITLLTPRNVFLGNKFIAVVGYRTVQPVLARQVRLPSGEMTILRRTNAFHVFPSHFFLICFQYYPPIYTKVLQLVTALH